MPTLLDRGFSISTLTGTGGEGKSYITVHDLALNRLVRFNNHLLTNLPLHVDLIAEYVAKQRNCTAEDVAKRIHLIPKDTLDNWADGHGGPWDYADTLKGTPFDLIIDEAHRFCPPGKVDKQWQDFLGEARHPPYALHRVQFLTQSVTKVAKPIDTHAKVRYRLEKGDTRRGFMGVSMGDVYQLIGSITGTVTPLVYRVEEIKDASEKWQKNGEDAFTYRGDIFKLYDSHSDAGGSSEATDFVPEPEEFERRPRLLPAKRDYNDDGGAVLTAPTWAWFIGRNMAPVMKVVGVFAVLMFLTNGGLGFAIGQAAGQMSAYVNGAFGLKPHKKEPGDVKTLAEVVIDVEREGCACKREKELIGDLSNRVRRDRDANRSLGGVSAIAPEYVAFRSGDVVRVGGRIGRGPHAGETVNEIDYEGRRVRVSDGSWVQLSSAENEPDEPNAEVRELLQRADQAIAEQPTEGTNLRSILEPSDPGHAADASPRDAKPRNRP